MLLELVGCPQEILAMGAREHAILATESGEAVSKRFAEDDWTCHVCRTRIQGYMEIDHVGSHEPCGTEGIRTICQFCHNLRHLVWAALRGRMRLIWAPGLDQSFLTRIAWQVLFTSESESEDIKSIELAESAQTVADDVTRRERVLGHILGSSHPEGFLEALFSARSLMNNEAFEASASRLDSFVRFWPTAAGRISGESIPAASAFGCWKEGRFADLSAAAAGQYWQHEITTDRFFLICGRETGISHQGQS